MIESIKEIIRQAEEQGTYLDESTITRMQDYFDKNSRRVSIANFITKNSPQIIDQVLREYSVAQDALSTPDDQDGIQHSIKDCQRDLDDFLRYSIFAMLQEDTAILDEQVLNTLKETYKSTEISLDQIINTIQVLKKVTVNLVTNELGNQASHEIQFYLDYLIKDLIKELSSNKDSKTGSGTQQLLKNQTETSTIESEIEANSSIIQSESSKKKGSLDDLISLFNEWTKDESGYDQKVYPLVEEGLQANRFSL